MTTALGGLTPRRVRSTTPGLPVSHATRRFGPGAILTLTDQLTERRGDPRRRSAGVSLYGAAGNLLGVRGFEVRSSQTSRRRSPRRRACFAGAARPPSPSHVTWRRPAEACGRDFTPPTAAQSTAPINPNRRYVAIRARQTSGRSRSRYRDSVRRSDRAVPSSCSRQLSRHLVDAEAGAPSSTTTARLSPATLRARDRSRRRRRGD